MTIGHTLQQGYITSDYFAMHRLRRRLFCILYPFRKWKLSGVCRHECDRGRRTHTNPSPSEEAPHWMHHLHYGVTDAVTGRQPLLSSEEQKQPRRSRCEQG